MIVSDEHLTAALHMLLRMDAGFYVGFADLLEIGQLENLNFWVESRSHDGTQLWYADDLPLDEAIAAFLRIRSERQLGYDIERELMNGGGDDD